MVISKVLFWGGGCFNARAVRTLPRVIVDWPGQVISCNFGIADPSPEMDLARLLKAILEFANHFARGMKK
jgi:hypothetical protein